MKYYIDNWVKDLCLHGYKWTANHFCMECYQDIRFKIFHPEAMQESEKQQKRRWDRLAKKGLLPSSIWEEHLPKTYLRELKQHDRWKRF